jgi:hypothetical protein
MAERSRALATSELRVSDMNDRLIAAEQRLEASKEDLESRQRIVTEAEERVSGWAS